MGYFVRAHRCIADEDDLVIGVVAAQHFAGGCRFIATAQIVTPDMVVEEIVKIKMFQSLEFRFGCAKQ